MGNRVYRYRGAIVESDARNAGNVAAYMPGNYTSIPQRDNSTLILGIDDHGWTLDGYVIPRLASGLIVATEIPRPFLALRVEDIGYLLDADASGIIRDFIRWNDPNGDYDDIPDWADEELYDVATDMLSGLED